MDVEPGDGHRFPMAGKLMTQAELMAWEQKARRWVILGLVGLVTGIFGVGLLTLEISYRMLKQTPVMTEAVARILADPGVREAVGEPVKLGWAVTGELEDMPDRGTARMVFSLRGSRDHAKVTLRSEKSPAGLWKFLLLEVQPIRGPVLSCADR
jgi:hypothetical protein